MPLITVRCVYSLALLLGELGGVCAGEEGAPEELYPDAGKHEDQEQCHQHDVPDGLDGNKHTLNHMLWDARDADGLSW